MKKILPKTEAKKKIEKFFEDIGDKSTKDIKKIKRLAMAYNIPLREKRKFFCKKCLMPYLGKEKIRIKNEIKTVTCEDCGYVSRIKLK